MTGVDTVAAPTTTEVKDVRTFTYNNTRNFDVLLHCAANVGGRENIETNYLDMIENVEIDRVVFDWAIDHVRQVIYPSSSAIYPVDVQMSGNHPLSETMIDFAQNKIGVSDHLYGWCKLTAERMLWQIHSTTKLQIHILRPFSGYGPDQSLFYPMPNLIYKIKTQPHKLEVWGNGQQTRDWVHISDIIRTIEWCSKDSHKYLTLNVGTGVPTSFVDLIELIYNLLYDAPCPDIQRLMDKPNGVQCRVADVGLQAQYNVIPLITLKSGIQTLL